VERHSEVSSDGDHLDAVWKLDEERADVGSDRRQADVEQRRVVGHRLVEARTIERRELADFRGPAVKGAMELAGVRGGDPRLKAAGVGTERLTAGHAHGYQHRTHDRWHSRHVSIVP
jgi:hypothetical protein